jgi:hypothetical protein
MDCGVGARSSGGGEASLRKAVRAALAGSVAVAALLTASLDPASAAPAAMTTHRKPVHAKAARKDPPLQQPLIEVSIARQQLTLYDKGQVIAHAPVSTGMAGHLTPTGIFSVIGKEVFHRSNIYSGAPMPFMQRITWSGVALHAGVLPGYPASHGCIRMPPAFAVRLFHMTQRGARVLVMHNEVAPVPFENAHLFTRPKPADKVSELVPPPGLVTAQAIALVRAAETQTPSRMSDAVAARHMASPPAQPTPPAIVPAAAAAASSDAAKDAQTDRAQESAPAKVKDAATAPPAKSPAVTGDGPAPASQQSAHARDPAQEAARDSDAKDVAKKAANAQPVPKAGSNPASKPTSETAASQAAPASVAPQIAATPEMKNGHAATGTVLVTPVTVTPAHPVEVPKAFAPSAAPATAAPPAVQAVAPAPVVAPAPAVKASLEPYGPERPLRAGPITVFISKKEGKLYVRKAFQPVFSAPISIVHPEQPLGTHLYTAVEQNPDGLSFRWLVVTLPSEHVARKKTEVVHYVTVRGHKVPKVEKVNDAAPAPATAAEALERIEISQAARERIAALMSPGASLIISDKGLGGETGEETDFIVLTSR